MIMFTIIIALYAIILIAYALGVFTYKVTDKYYNPIDSSIKEWEMNTKKIKKYGKNPGTTRVSRTL